MLVRRFESSALAAIDFMVQIDDAAIQRVENGIVIRTAAVIDNNDAVTQITDPGGEGGSTWSG